MWCKSKLVGDNMRRSTEKFRVTEIYMDSNHDDEYFKNLEDALYYFIDRVSYYRGINNEDIDVVYVQDIDAGETVVRYAPYE